MNKSTLGCIIMGIGLVLASGCASSKSQHPLTYVALTRPTGAIVTSCQQIENKHSRGGPYFLNYGFRPAPDIEAYVEKAQTDGDVDVLRNADVRMVVPFAFDLLLFGFQGGSDTVQAN